jgi:hypothetical protein
MSKSQTTMSLTPSTGLQLRRTAADISYVNKAWENIANKRVGERKIGVTIVSYKTIIN